MKTAMLVAVASLLWGGVASAQDVTALPDGVVPEMVSSGETYYKSIGLCFACHGMNAKGLPGVGADLTDDEWFHGDGTYEAIVRQIRDGVSPEVSTGGVMMPPKGGSQITEDQIRAIASYVWALSHKPQLIQGEAS